MKVDERARVVMQRRRSATTSSPPARSWRATSSDSGYVAGVGMTIGTVFGEIAGRGIVRMAEALTDAARKRSTR